MDTREAIEWLKFIKEKYIHGGDDGFDEKRRQAIDYAVSVLANVVTVQDNTEITEELLEQLRNTPVTILQEEPTIEVAQEWISVKDRLPRNFSTVIAYEPGRGAWEANYENGEFEWADNEKLAFATHWMPMPQPPI